MAEENKGGLRPDRWPRCRRARGRGRSPSARMTDRSWPAPCFLRATRNRFSRLPARLAAFSLRAPVLPPEVVGDDDHREDDREEEAEGDEPAILPERGPADEVADPREEEGPADISDGIEDEKTCEGHFRHAGDERDDHVEDLTNLPVSIVFPPWSLRHRSASSM